ncbi:MAG: diacylglycerol kinase family protein [Acidobacteriota bacterium]
MSETLFYLNRRAGSGRAAEVWRRLVAARPELASARCIDAHDPQAGAAALESHLSSAEPPAGAGRRVIAIGGDGTLHWVIQRLLAQSPGSRPAVGIVPAGTGSDFARHLGLPKGPEAALHRALSAAPRPIDVIAAETLGEDGAVTGCRYVFNVASLGLSGMVAERVNAMGDRGAFPFVRATVHGILRYRSRRCRIRIDGEDSYEGGLFLLAVANAPYFGKAMHIAPGAQIDDGLLDVVLIEPLSRAESLLRLPQIFFGAHVSSKKVRCLRARTVEVEPLEAMPSLELDGELWDPPPLRFRVLPQAAAFLY